MQYALVNTTSTIIQLGHWEGEGITSQYVVAPIEVVPGTICNLISYDGSSTYVPEDGFELREVPDSAQIGDLA